jgi:hypothetical protein
VKIVFGDNVGNQTINTYSERLREKRENNNGSLTISARSGYFSFRKVSKSLRQLKTAVTKIPIYSNFAEIVKEPIKNQLFHKPCSTYNSTQNKKAAINH